MPSTTDTARFDATGATIAIEAMVIAEPRVIEEARHWTTGRRLGEAADAAAVGNADVTAFVHEALTFGARVLASTAHTADTRLLESMVKGVGDQTAQASKQATEITERATAEAAKAVTQVASDAKKAIVEA